MADGDALIIGEANESTNETTRLVRNRPTTTDIAFLVGNNDGDALVGICEHDAAVVGAATGGQGVHGRSQDGIGVVGVSLALAGVLGRCGAGEGVHGESANAEGVLGFSPNKPGVAGGSTTHVGVLGTSETGVAVWGNGDTGEGVHGESRTSPGVVGESQDNDGVRGRSAHVGVRGQSFGANTDSYGVFGQGKYGVVGHGTRVRFSSGVYGLAAAGGLAGVEGHRGGGLYAGYFEGRVRVTGRLEKAGGGFSIDHPLDPTNRYLNHSFVESPEMKCVYDGVEELDEDGSAWVRLPEWFEALNSDYRYQLTPIGAPAPRLHVAAEVSGNRFRIAGGEAGMRVSWQVTGVRQDAWAKNNPIEVEEDKSDDQRGRYLHPEAHGVPEERAVNWERREELRRQMDRPEHEPPQPSGLDQGYLDELNRRMQERPDVASQRREELLRRLEEHRQRMEEEHRRVGDEETP
jgi:hypothetical protein